MMRKILKKIGNSIGAIFNKEDQKAYDLEEGDIINMDIKKVERKNRIKK